MFRQLKTKIIISLSIGLLISSFGIQAEIAREWREWKEGEPYVKAITTTLINKSKYSIKLTTQGEVIARGVQDVTMEYSPVGTRWLQPRNTIQAKSDEDAPCCNARIDFYDPKTSREAELKSYAFRLKGKSEDHVYEEFNVHVEAKPVNFFYPPLIAIKKGEEGKKGWIYPFWDYTITVTDR